MNLLTYTNYCQRAKEISIDYDPTVYEPFEEADSSAEMREFGKIWTIASTVAAIGLFIFDHSCTKQVIWFPIIGGVLWAGFFYQHREDAQIAENLLLNTLQHSSKRTKHFRQVPKISLSWVIAH